MTSRLALIAMRTKLSLSNCENLALELYSHRIL